MVKFQFLSKGGYGRVNYKKSYLYMYLFTNRKLFFVQKRVQIISWQFWGWKQNWTNKAFLPLEGGGLKLLWLQAQWIFTWAYKYVVIVSFQHLYENWKKITVWILRAPPYFIKDVWRNNLLQSIYSFKLFCNKNSSWIRKYRSW